MVVNGYDIQFQLDSGVIVNVLFVREYKRICGDFEFKELKDFEVVFSMYNGIEIYLFGKRRISLCNLKNNGKYNFEFQIVSEENKFVFGVFVIQGMEFIIVNMQNILIVDEFVS